MYVLHNNRGIRFAGGVSAPMMVLPHPLHADQSQHFGRGVELFRPLEFIISTIVECNTAERCIIIVPTARRARALKRSVMRAVFAVQRQPVTTLHIYTLEQFILLCAQKLFRQEMPRLVSDGYSVALLEEAAVIATKRSALKFFAADRTLSGSQQMLSPVVIEKLHNIILGLKEDGITAAHLKEDIERGGNEIVDAAKLHDISVLFEYYERLLKGESLRRSVRSSAAYQQRLTDKPGLLAMLNEHLFAATASNGYNSEHESSSYNRLTEQWGALFPNIDMMLIDGFTEFKPPEQQLLKALYHASFHVRIVLDYSPINGPLFGGLDQTIESLQGRASVGLNSDDASNAPVYSAYSVDAEAQQRFETSPMQHTPLSSYIKRWLFNTTDDIRHSGLSNIVRIIGFEHRADEVRSIAKLIKHLASNQGVALRDICVVMRQTEQYTGLIREFFSLYDIPANITDRFALDKSPVVTAIFAVLDMVLLGFRREDVLRALQSPYLRFERYDGRYKRQLDGSNLVVTAERLRISGGGRFGVSGRERWMRKLKSRIESLRRRKVLFDAGLLSDRDEQRENELALEETELALADFTALSEMMPEPEQMMTVDEWMRFIKRTVIQQLRVRDSIIDFHAVVADMRRPRHGSQLQLQQLSQFLRLEEEVEKDARALTALQELLEEMVAIQAERAPLQRRAFADYVERLRTAVRSTRYQIREKLGYGVTVTTMEQIRGLDAQVIILCGMVDGEFPAQYMPESFLGKELTSSEERFLQKERIQFFQTVTHAVSTASGSATHSDESVHLQAKRLFITYPTVQNDAELVRSSFVDALLKITSLQQDGCVTHIRELRNELLTGKLNPHTNSDADLYRAIAFGVAADEEVVRNIALEYCARARQGMMTVDTQPISLLQVFQELTERYEHTRMKMNTWQQQIERITPYLRARLNAAMNVKESRVVLIHDSARYADEGDTALSSSSAGSKAYSISALEQYKKCPYQYFAARTLRLRETLQFDSSLSPLESGSLLHRVLYRFYSTLQQEALADAHTIRLLPREEYRGIAPEIIPVRLRAEQRAHYSDLLQSIAVEEIEAIRFEHPFFAMDREDIVGSQEKGDDAEKVMELINPTNDKVLDLLGINKKGSLQRWLDDELRRVDIEQRGWTHQPGLFEFAFGEPRSFVASRDHAYEPQRSIDAVRITETLTLRGKIDRIELDLESKTFLIGDYKTGAASNVASNNDINKGISLQMPLYAKAAQHLLKEVYGIDAQPEAMVYYLLSAAHSKGRSEKFVLLPASSSLREITGISERSTTEVVKTREELHEAVEQAVRYAEQSVLGMQRGEFSVVPIDKAVCSTCAYKPVCRISEQ
jgi:ATP-dependent helicase/DNAse subunit B